MVDNPQSNIRLVCSAIYYPLWGYFLGKRHNEIIKFVAETRGRKTTHEQQGFMTTENKFVTRDQAVPIAKDARQIPSAFKGTLTSEDLW